MPFDPGEGMMKKITAYVIALIVCIFLSRLESNSGEVEMDFVKIPAKGMVTMIDLGAKKCIPCKMMAPIMEKLEKVYQGKADIVFIDVWQNKEQASRFRISAIPTQIFFDKNGQEVYRHTGFMDEGAIIQQLTKMGVPGPEKEQKKKG
jgi:thioredoxin 1